MPRGARRRDVLKWTGVALCALILVVWFASRWWYAQLMTDPRSDRLIVLSVTSGVIRVLTVDMRYMDRNYSGRRPAHFGWQSLPAWRWRPSHERIANGFGVDTPLWIPWLVVSLPTVWLWRFGRRHPSGTCHKCGYDLSGLSLGTTCPECGRAPRFVHPAERTG